MHRIFNKEMMNYSMNESSTTTFKSIALQFCATKRGIEYHCMSMFTTLWVIIWYLIIFKVIENHETLRGTRYTLLKYLGVFDIAHDSFRAIIMFLGINWQHSNTYVVLCKSAWYPTVFSFH